MKRRDFIILTGIGASSATLLSACGHPENKLIPALIADELYVPGMDYFKASVCGLCEASCGILVRTREHRANKIEGNPLHPVNRGGLCARGQAGLQVVYNPDRIIAPLKREGERGSGRFTQISWDEAIKTVADTLRRIKTQHGSSSQIVFASGDPRGVTSLVAEHFVAAYGKGSLVSTRPLNRQPLLEGYAGIYGQPSQPLFDIANASYVISFGARFLETWQSPVMYSRAYGEFRASSESRRGRLVQVEPRMTQTGANADRWLAARAGTEGLLALAMAEVIIREGLVKAAPPQAGFVSGPLSDYAPEKRAEQIGIAAERIIEVAREYGEARRAIAIGEGTTSPDEARGPELKRRERERLAAIHYLNHLAGNINKVGGVILTGDNQAEAFQRLRPDRRIEWEAISETSFASEAVKAVMLHQANPVYEMAGVEEKLKKAELIVSFASFMDETTQMADLVMPDNSYLERWDLRAANYVEVGTEGEAEKVEVKTAMGLMQPVIERQLDTRQTADVMIEISREMGGVMSEGMKKLKADTAEDIVKREAQPMRQEEGREESEEDFWEKMMEQGVLVRMTKRSGKARMGEGRGKARKAGEKGIDKSSDRTSQAQQTQQPTQSETQSEKESKPQKQESDYPLVLVAYEHAALGFGDSANLPWLQELPDPMTTAMWGSWIEINPRTAAELGIADGDLIEAQSEQGVVRAAAVIYPAIRPEVVAMAYGQGHSGYGRYAKARGVNAAVVAPFRAGAISEMATIGVRVRKISGEASLARFGTSLPEQVESKR